MKRTATSLILSFAVANGATAGELSINDFQAVTTASIVNLCSADEETDLGKYAIGFCYGWLEGIEQFYAAMLADERFDIKPVACPERPLTRQETREAFVQWGNANAEVQSVPPLEGIIRAAKELYPCS